MADEKKIIPIRPAAPTQDQEVEEFGRKVLVPLLMLANVRAHDITGFRLPLSHGYMAWAAWAADTRNGRPYLPEMRTILADAREVLTTLEEIEAARSGLPPFSLRG